MYNISRQVNAFGQAYVYIFLDEWTLFCHYGCLHSAVKERYRNNTDVHISPKVHAIKM